MIRTKSIQVRTVFLVNIAILVIISVAYMLLMQQQRHTLEAQLLEQEKQHSQLGAMMVGKMIDEAINRQQFTAAAFFDSEYIPVPDSTPQQYHTQYDSFLFEAIHALQKEFVNDPGVTFAAAVDVNGYQPSGSSTDEAASLNKQIVNDPIAIKAAQNEKIGLQQQYQLPSGQRQWDISSPIYVMGKHWGAFRLGVSPAQLNSALAAFQASLLRVLLLVLVVSALASLLVLRQALQPVKELARQTAALADGDIEKPISTPGITELDGLAASVERLRVSLQVAMDRLHR